MNPVWWTKLDDMTFKKKQQVRLLVIDDSDRYLKSIRECVEMCPPDYDLTIEFADSESKTRELMKSWDPSVVLLDAHLPAVNALQQLSCTHRAYRPSTTLAPRGSTW